MFKPGDRVICIDTTGLSFETINRIKKHPFLTIKRIYSYGTDDIRFELLELNNNINYYARRFKLFHGSPGLIRRNTNIRK